MFLPLFLFTTLIFSQDYQVEAGNMYYSPSNLTIEVGETVEFYNAQGYHDVVVTDGPETFSFPASIEEISKISFTIVFSLPLQHFRLFT